MAPRDEHATPIPPIVGNQLVTVDYNHPLFSSLGDVSEIQIISFQLTGIENYAIWYRLMRIALFGRNTMVMVDGSSGKEKFPIELGNHWKIVNAIVLSWIMNSVAKNLLGGIMYASEAHAVWEDPCERFTKIDGSTAFNLHKEIAALIQGRRLFQHTSQVSRIYGYKFRHWYLYRTVIVRNPRFSYSIYINWSYFNSWWDSTP